jgi:hypothetical protein
MGNIINPQTPVPLSTFISTSIVIIERAGEWIRIHKDQTNIIARALYSIESNFKALFPSLNIVSE